MHRYIAGFSSRDCRAGTQCQPISLGRMRQKGNFCLFAGVDTDSGTTLAAAKLGHHSSVRLIGRESNLFTPICSLQTAKRVVREWDMICEMDGQQVLVEKTPKHIHSLRHIRVILPDARFLIMVRNPLDTIASLYLRFGDLDGCIHRWTVDNRAALRWQGDERVRTVRYEDLTCAPVETFQQLCDFLSLDWESGILQIRGSAYDQAVQSGNMAIRQEQVAGPIRPRLGSWRSVFNDSQRGRILKYTEKVSQQLGYEWPESV